MLKKIKDIWYYMQGWTRYHLYYNKKWNWLIRKHIREQISVRINSMNPQCYTDGSCIKCGCTTTALQMASKPCEGDCYPRMLNKKEWKEINESYYTIGHDPFKPTSIDDFSNMQCWTVKNNEFKKIN